MAMGATNPPFHGRLNRAFPQSPLGLDLDSDGEVVEGRPRSCTLFRPAACRALLVSRRHAER